MNRFIEDLKNYSKKDLCTLKQYYDLNTDNEDLMYDIAYLHYYQFKHSNLDRPSPPSPSNIPRPSFADRPSPPSPSNIPRPSFIRTSQSIPEGMSRLEWVKQQQEKWRKQAEQYQEQETQDNIYKEECQNEMDYITMDEWSSTNIPDVQIKYINSADKIPENYFCYTKEDLIKYFSEPYSILRQWFQEYNDTPELRDLVNHSLEINSEGYGGRASIVREFYKLPDRSAYIVNKDINDIDTQKMNAILLSNDIRMGNKESGFYESGMHGQLPGNPVYYLLSINDTKYDALRMYLKDQLSILTKQEVIDKMNETYKKTWTTDGIVSFISKDAVLKDLMTIGNILLHLEPVTDKLERDIVTEQYISYLRRELEPDYEFTPPRLERSERRTDLLSVTRRLFEEEDENDRDPRELISYDDLMEE